MNYLYYFICTDNYSTYTIAEPEVMTTPTNMMEPTVMGEDVVIIQKQYTCHQCKWITFIASPHILDATGTHVEQPPMLYNIPIMCYLCSTREHYYLPRDLCPKTYRNTELLADKRYRLTNEDPPSSRPVRAVNHWSFVYKNYLDDILRNFKM